MSFGQALLFYFVSPVLTLLVILLLVSIVLSWLIAFNVVNSNNQLVSTIWRFSTGLTEPILRPIRSVIPPLGGMDLSPLILLLVIYFVQNYVVRDVLWRALA
ncbi:MAG: YggT family protein [Pseudomonadota bacterium]